MLVNLLIAMLNSTYEETMEKAALTWRVNFARKVLWGEELLGLVAPWMVWHVRVGDDKRARQQTYTFRSWATAHGSMPFLALSSQDEMMDLLTTPAHVKHDHVTTSDLAELISELKQELNELKQGQGLQVSKPEEPALPMLPPRRTSICARPTSGPTQHQQHQGQDAALGGVRRRRRRAKSPGKSQQSDSALAGAEVQTNRPAATWLLRGGTTNRLNPTPVREPDHARISNSPDASTPAGTPQDLARTWLTKQSGEEPWRV